MNIDSLRKFLIKANKAGYATGQYDRFVKEKDKSMTISYESGDYRAHDNFFGGEPYGGRYLIFYKGNPVWIMVYYGKVYDSVKEFEPVYKFLQKCLSNMPDAMPLRGPKEFSEGKYSYRNTWEGNLDEFFGKEVILQSGQKIYNATYTGGLVDVRKEQFQIGSELNRDE